MEKRRYIILIMLVITKNVIKKLVCKLLFI